MRRVTIKIEGKEYDIQLSDDFAESVEEELEKELPPFENNSIKELLQAYLKKCYDCHVMQKRLREILKKIEIQ